MRRVAIAIGLLALGGVASAQLPPAPVAPVPAPTTTAPPDAGMPVEDAVPTDAAPVDAAPVDAAPELVADAPPVPVVELPPPNDPLTSPAWRARRSFDLGWQLLDLPERAVELALLPVGLLVEFVETYRVDKIVTNALEFFDGRLKLSPRLKLSFGDGLGLGAKAKIHDVVFENAEVEIGGIYRLDGDWLVDTEASHRLGSLERRLLHVLAFAERDANQRYYGIGGASNERDRRVLGVTTQAVFAGIDLHPSDWYDYGGLLEIGVSRERLFPGVSSSDDAVGGADDPVAPPPGFEHTTGLVHLRLTGRYDTRDTVGRPTRGTLVEVGVRTQTAVDGASVGGVTTHAMGSWFLPVLPDGRTLVLVAGGSAALPLFQDDIPLSSLSTLGRETHLRGYDRSRFHDRYAVWTSAEYRFPIYEYLNTDVGLDAFGFADVGTAFGETAFAFDRIRYSLGGGLRAAHETTLLFEVTAGWSPEGWQLRLGVEKQL